MAHRFTATTAWSAERPETLVVCCSDGRYHAQLEEFVRAEVSERADLFAVPGGPAWFDPWSSTFEQARVLEECFALMAKYHDLRSIWLIAHQGCSYYRVKHGQRSDQELLALQCSDLARAAEVIAGGHPHLAVRRIYAGVEGGRVVFTTLK